MNASVPLGSAGLWLTGLERGALLAGLSLALGGLAGRGLARQYKGTGPAPLPLPWALRGSLLGLVAAAALAITALADRGLAARLAVPPVAGLRSGATLSIAVAEIVCFALAAALLRLRKPGAAVLPLLGVALAEALRAHPEGMITAAGAALTICHLVPAVLWAGMLVYTLRAASAWRADPAAMRGLIRLYASAIAWLFAVVVLTGILSALLLVPIGSLLTTTYGVVLIIKTALVAVAGGLAVAGRVWLRATSEPGAGPAKATRAEAVALAVVLLLTGILTVLTPPAKPVFPAAVPAIARHLPG